MEKPNVVKERAQLSVTGVMVIGLACGLLGSAIGIYAGGQRASDAAAAYIKNTDACSEGAMKLRQEVIQMQFGMESAKRQQETDKIIIDSCVKRGWIPGKNGGVISCVNPDK